MRCLIALSCWFAVATGFPQDLKVVRPNHYLQQGTFGKEQHLLPNSFYTPGQQVEDDLRNLNVAAVPQQQSQGTRALQKQDAVPGATFAASEQVAVTAQKTNSAEHVQDSYANIGGASGRIASALTNTNEYGETVPPAFSSLQQDSYAYYHGHKV